MKVIATRGSGYYLVETRTVDDRRWGRIWNLARREMSQEMFVESILRFGYWQVYTGPVMPPSAFEGVRMLEGGRPR